MLRRLTENLRTQNWSAIILELFVVVVGIFLAIQVERWYSEQRLRANIQERLVALAEDFAGNRIELDRSIEIRTLVIDAALQLLELDEQSPTPDQYDQFYELLGAASKTFTPRLRRGAYDVLIATGEIELLADEMLKSELADFYTHLDELLVFNQGIWAVDRSIFEPFVVRNLDHVEMLQYVHPGQIRQAMPTQDRAAFLSVLGSSEFEGVVAAKWHATADERIRLQRLKGRLIRIEEQLEENLKSRVK